MFDPQLINDMKDIQYFIAERKASADRAREKEEREIKIGQVEIKRIVELFTTNKLEVRLGNVRRMLVVRFQEITGERNDWTSIVFDMLGDANWQLKQYASKFNPNALIPKTKITYSQAYEYYWLRRPQYHDGSDRLLSWGFVNYLRNMYGPHT
jgi:hypothetical protein